MMRVLFLLAAMMMTAEPAWSADSLGIFGGWGAFRDAGGDDRRCYAISQPDRVSAGGNVKAAYASIGTWPGKSVRGQLYLHLSRAPAKGSRVYLSLGERRFALISNQAQAWSQDKRMDAAIIAAMRSTATMSVEGTGPNKRPFNDLYVLKGAATAMDAAALGCAAR